MATIGLPKSASVMPVARHRARAPAMLRPWVEVAERSCCGICQVCQRRGRCRKTRPRRPTTCRDRAPDLRRRYHFVICPLTTMWDRLTRRLGMGQAERMSSTGDARVLLT